MPASAPKNPSGSPCFGVELLDHYRRPRNRAPIQGAQGSAEVANPLCGDQVRVEIRLEEGRVAGISARARGCSITIAAGSIMSELVQGCDREQLGDLARRLERLVSDATADPDPEPYLQVFASVARLPSRERCALLPWQALEAALETL